MSNKYAPFFFEELASMKQTKPAIDLERRRRAINLRRKMNISRDETIEFFYVLEQYKLGKLEIIKNVVDGNSKFHWTSKDIGAVELAQEIIKLSKSAPPTESSRLQSGMTYIYRTRAGDIVKLTQDDIEDIKRLN